MASVSMEGFDELEKMLGSLASKVGGIAEKAVNAGIPPLVEELSGAIREVVDPEQSTGGLARSIQATKAKTNDLGAYAVARPVGRDKKGTRYGERLAYVEYGARGKAPRPVRQKAANRAESECVRRMEDVIQSAIEEASGQ